MTTMMAKPAAQGGQSGPGRSRAQDIDRHVGARMRERRIMLGLTQQQMAERLGISREHYNGLERGRYPVTERTALVVELLLRK